MTNLSERFARYVAHQWPEVTDIRVEDLTRVHGGASRETYRLRLKYQRDGAPEERPLILRRDPSGSLIETERATEYHAYRALHGTAIPVPEPLWLEEDEQWLDRPFFVMEQITDCEASPQALLLPPYQQHTQRMGEQKWRILGELNKMDPQELGLADVMPAVKPEECWQRELGHWEGVIDEDEMAPQPIGRAAIRWLRRHPPPPAQKISVIHADFRTGNFLADSQGNIRAILDWEMTHLGDPIEDLAWSLSRIWCWARDDRPGGLLPRERAIELWEEASGLRADAETLHWWELFSGVKGLGIWLSSGREYATGTNHDPVLGFTGWWLPNSQNRAILETMGHLK
jgi:aminoglycoside phosphotransferase (APT) family kinase protein